MTKDELRADILGRLYGLSFRILELEAEAAELRQRIARAAAEIDFALADDGWPDGYEPRRKT